MGNVGQVGFPVNIADFHSEMLEGRPDIGAGGDPSLLTDYQAEFNSLHGAANNSNPYNSLAAYDPSSDASWGAMSTRQTALNTVVDAVTTTQTVSSVTTTPGITVDFDVGSDVDAEDTEGWDDIIHSAIATAEELIPIDTSHVNNQVSAFRKSSKIDLAQGYNRIMGGLTDINGVIQTAAPTQLAILELLHAARVDEYQARTQNELELQGRTARAQFVSNAANSMVGMMQVKTARYAAMDSEDRTAIEAKDLKLRSDEVELHKETAEFDADAKFEALNNERIRTKVEGSVKSVATQVQEAALVLEGNHREAGQNVIYDVDETLWVMGMLDIVGNAIDISGIPTVPPKPTMWQSVLGAVGMFGGMGANAASMFIG